MVRKVLLVTGSRLYDDVWKIRRVLASIADGAAESGITELVIRHGACYPNPDKVTKRIPARSADWLTHLWIQMFGAAQPVTIVEQERPADWAASCRPSCKPGHRKARGTSMYCPMAGVHRNRDMILEDPRPDWGVAFLRDNSSGTRHCVSAMREFGIPVEEVPYTLTDSPTR